MTSTRAPRQGSHQDGNLPADDEIKVYGGKLGPGNAAFFITTLADIVGLMSPHGTQTEGNTDGI